jgi:hypothetical protein
MAAPVCPTLLADAHVPLVDGDQLQGEVGELITRTAVSISSRSLLLTLILGRRGDLPRQSVSFSDGPFQSVCGLLPEDPLSGYLPFHVHEFV